MPNPSPHRKSGIIEACGVRIALKNTEEFRQAVLMIKAQSGEDISSQHYIILSSVSISEEKRAEVKAWYKAKIDKLVNDFNVGNRKRRNKAIKSLNSLGWTFEGNS